MKRVKNSEIIVGILLNIGTLIISVCVWLTYNHRQTIINSEEPIQNYSVLEVNYHAKTGSSIVIEFNGKQFDVRVPRNKCKPFEPQKVKFFYDREKDDVFEESEVTVRMIVACLICYLWFCILLFIVIRKRLSGR